MVATYTKQTWHDEPATDTPISASRLAHMEDGIFNSYLTYDPENPANKGQANGYASLNALGQVPAEQLPSYVDDVLEYVNKAAFPSTGETGKIYVDQTTERIWRWSGSIYIEIAPSPGSTDNVAEGSTNLYFTNARADARVAAGITGKADKTTTISAGTGLTGGGDLSANRSLAVAYGTTSGTACQGNDGRLSDARTPTAHSHAASDITSGTLSSSLIPAITSAMITDGTIVNADISGSAAIALSKLATGYAACSVNGTATTTNIWRGTVAQYTALGSKDSNTIYFQT